MNQARRIGMGMKPRELPTTEGQNEVPSDPIKEQITAAVEGGDLESVSAEPEQATAEPEVEIEPTLHATEVQEVPQEAFDALAAAMKASEMESGAEPVQNLEYDKSELDALAEKLTEVFTEEVEEEINPRTFIQPMDVGQQFPIQSEDGKTIIHKISEPYSPQPPKAEDFVITKSGRRKLAEAELGLGQLESGEYRHTVRIAESYVEGAKQQAEADNQSLEDWLTVQLHCYLEQYWWANGPK